MEKSLNFIGLIKKAGKLEIGTESTESAVIAGNARLVMSAADASQNSVKQAKRIAESGGIQHIILPFEKADIGSIVGRGLPGMLAVTDEGFASALSEKLNTDFPGRYEDTVKAFAALKRETKKAAVSVKPGKRRM